MDPTDTTITLPDLTELYQQAEEVHKKKWHHLKLDLETITPIYGGGTSAGEPDILLPFRPRAIKNNLRHWWWLLNRHKDEYKNDSQRLYRDMTALWGGASDKVGESRRAKVRVQVAVEPVEDKRITPYMPFRITKSQSSANQPKLATTVEESHFYALWMLKPKTCLAKEALEAKLQTVRTKPAHALTTSGKKFADELSQVPGLFADKNMPARKLLLPGIAWSLELDLAQSLSQEQKVQVRDSLHAWLMLGGVGARTTRGLGRSRLTNEIQTNTKAFQSLDDTWNTTPKWFEQAFGNRHAIQKNLKLDDGMKAWENALAIYKAFRQARQKDVNGNRRKQSYGHMANGLRKLTGIEGHPLRTAFKQADGIPIPEVMFGTPIVYQFITKKGAKPEPGEGQIRLGLGKELFERYTSPLLVTCVHIGSGQFAPVCLCFRHHTRDVQDKDIRVTFDKTSERTISAGQWWPDLNSLEGKNQALDWLAEEFRNHPIPKSDTLYEELMDAAYRADHPTDGDPLLVCLNFFRAHQLSNRS